MCPCKSQWTGSHHRTIPADVVMVTDITETTAEVHGAESLYRKRTVLAGGAAMHHDVVDCSHVI